MFRNNSFIREAQGQQFQRGAVPTQDFMKSNPAFFPSDSSVPGYWGNSANLSNPATAVYNNATGFNVSARVGSLTPHIIGTPGVVNAIGGRDFLTIDVTQEYLPYIQQASYLRKHLKTVPMQTTSKYIPKIAGPARVYATSEGSVMQQTTIPTTTVALIAKAMAVSFAIPREIADDSFINLLPAVRDHLVDRFVLAEEEAFLLGDQRVFAYTDSVRGLFNGLSVSAEYDSTRGDDVMADNGSPYINAGGNPFSIEHINEALENLDLLGQNPDHILGIISRRHARTIRGDSTLLRTLTNFGPSPTFRTGRIGQVFGINMVQTNLLNSNIPVATADGYYWAFMGFGSDTAPYTQTGSYGDDGQFNPAYSGDAIKGVVAGGWTEDSFTSGSSSWGYTDNKLDNPGVGNRVYSPFASPADAKRSYAPYTEALFIHKDTAVIGDRQKLELEMSAHTLLAARSLLMVAHQRLAFALQLRKGSLKVLNIG